MALNKDEFEQYCNRLQLIPAAREMIAHIRSSEPRRRVQGGAGNVTVRYPSPKMQVIIQAESDWPEFSAVLEYEHDDDVHEYYDQPDPQLKLTYASKSGRKVSAFHTADYFLIRRKSAGWEEHKTEEELIKLAEAQPNRYVRGENRTWRCPPAEQYATQFGLYYRLRSSSEVNPVWRRNIEFLHDYLHSEPRPVDRAAEAEILALVKTNFAIKLNDVLQQVECATSDDVYQLIVAKEIFADLERVPLAEPRRVPLFLYREAAQAYDRATTESASLALSLPSSAIEIVPRSVVTWDGRAWTIANRGTTEVTLLSSDDHLSLPNAAFESLIRDGKIRPATESVHTGLAPEAIEILRNASPEALRIQSQRMQLLMTKWATGEKLNRTERDWQLGYREAEKKWGDGSLGLIPLRHRMGNHTPRLSSQVKEVGRQVIDEEYETSTAISEQLAYGKLKEKCDALRLQAPSFVEFVTWIKQRPRGKQTKARYGRRAAAAEAPFYWHLSNVTPRHGDFPFHIVHIDHTLLDIELVDPEADENLGRPWLTLLIDASTRRIIAFWLTFDPPSYRSCMMVLREMVRRWNRLPFILVVDNGPEFRSVYFESFLARHRIIKRSRPKASPRHGSVIERFFGITNEQFVHNLAGNTKLTRNVRQITKSINPKNLAVWSLSGLYSYCCNWFYEFYDTKIHSVLGRSPRDAFAAGMATGGARPMQFVAYDVNFQKDAMPTTRQETAKVELNRGFKIRGDYFTCKAFRNSRYEGLRVPIRYDPDNAGIAYAYLNHPEETESETGQSRWVECRSAHYTAFVGRSEREIQIATEELRKKKKQYNDNFPIRAAELARFLQGPQAEEERLARQRIKDRESRKIVALIDGSQLEPIDDGPELNLSGTPISQPLDSAAGPTAESGESSNEPDDYGRYTL